MPATPAAVYAREQPSCPKPPMMHMQKLKAARSVSLHVHQKVCPACLGFNVHGRHVWQQVLGQDTADRFRGLCLPCSCFPALAGPRFVPVSLIARSCNGRYSMLRHKCVRQLSPLNVYCLPLCYSASWSPVTLEFGVWVVS